MARFPSTRSGARAAILAVAVLALSASQALAQYGGDHGKRIEITPFGGWYIASDLYTAANAQIGINNSVIYGGRLGIFPNDRLGIEGSYGRASSDLTIKSYSALFPSSTPLGKLTTEQWDGNFVFTQRRMGNPHATGFFTLGFGATTFKADTKTTSGSTSNSHFSWNIGIGSKYDLSEKVALRIDGRYRAADTNHNTSSGVYCDFYGFCYSYSSSWYSSGEISACLAYKLGG